MTAELQRPYLASYCMIRANDAILVQRRFNTGYLDGHWALPSVHEGVSTDDERTYPLLHKGRKHWLEVSFRRNLENADFPAERAGCCLYVLSLKFGIRVFGIDEHRHHAY